MARERIYICAPWRGKTAEEREKNEQRTATIWRWLYEHGYHPVAPQLLYGRYLNDDDPEERRFGMAAGKEELLRCSEMWVFGETFSEGMKDEMRFAYEHKIPYRFNPIPNL